MNYLETAKKWLWSILDLGLVVVALAVKLAMAIGARARIEKWRSTAS